MNMENVKFGILLVVMPMVLLFGCKKDEDDDTAPTPPANEEELITTVLLTFADQETSSAVFEMRFTDTDGDGGNAPVITADTLPANRAYDLSIRVLNESVSPAEEITTEIQNEGVDHQFFFQSSVTNMLINYADADANGAPIGLLNSATTADPAQGTLVVTLRHQPSKGAAGVSSGDITNAGGETDIEVTFPVVVQ